MDDVVQVGTTDVSNFGDLLFPELLASNVPGLADRLIAASPTGGSSEWTGTWPRRTAVLDTPADSLLIIGGGNLIKTGTGGVPAYVDRPVAYQEMWHRPDRRVVAWNGLGVPRQLGAEALEIFRNRWTPPGYMAVRDGPSVNWLQRIAMTGATPQLIPDTAFAVASAWPRRAQEDDSTYITMSPKERDLDCGLEFFVARVREVVVGTGLSVVLLPLGPVHGDVELARAVADRAGDRNMVNVADYRDIEATCQMLGGAAVHIGSSLHGGIVSSAYGVPVAWVSQMPERGLPKLRAALRWMPDGTRLVAHWSTAFKWLLNRGYQGLTPSMTRPEVGEALAEHWKRIGQLVA